MLAWCKRSRRGIVEPTQLLRPKFLPERFSVPAQLPIAKELIFALQLGGDGEQFLPNPWIEIGVRQSGQVLPLGS